MREITASDFQRHPRRIQDLALSEPVAVTDHGRPKVVLLAFEEYARLKRRDKQAAFAWELPEELARQIETARMDARHARLDELLE